MSAIPSLVDGDWLEARLGEPDLVVLDATVRLSPVAADGSYTVESGRAGWERGHVPGSLHADLLHDLSDPEAPHRFTMPRPDDLADALGRLGVGDGRVVVLYDDDASMWAARLWWMLRALGFDDAALLDGGLGLWTQEGRPLTGNPTTPRPTRFVPRPRPGLIVGRHEVEEALHEGDRVLVNALQPEGFRGETNRYTRPGRIPTSVNVPSRGLLDPEDGTYLAERELTARFAEAGVLDGRPVIAYCGGGISAASVAFALTRIGCEDVALYDGSLAEWSADPSLPLVTGPSEDTTD